MVKTYTGVKKIIMTHPEEPGQPMQLGRPMPLFMVRFEDATAASPVAL